MTAMDFHTYDNTLYEKVYQTAYQAAAELIETAGMKAGQILVVGCSTSEVGGEKIGTYSSPELAAKVFGGIYAAVQEKGIYLAAQCCEHLNRAIVIEQEAAEKYGYEQDYKNQQIIYKRTLCITECRINGHEKHEES